MYCEVDGCRGLMFNVKLDIDDDIVQAIDETLKTAPGIMNTLVKRRFGKIKSKALARLRAEPALWPKGKRRRWKSERQRKYVIAKLREDDNLPYLRTHKL